MVERGDKMKSNICLRNHHSIFFFVLILVFPALAFADADKIFKDNTKAVVVVLTYNDKGELISQGSGFIVRADGAIVTNYHVISNAKGIKVKAGDKVLDVEGLILADKGTDLVILKVKGEKFQAVKIGDSEKATVGEKVYVISSPQGLENTISDGLLSGIREISSDKKVLQITAPVSSGSSGGPVFNTSGEVIGITTFLLEEAQNLNFAMPVNLIKNNIGSKKMTSLKDSSIEDYKKTAEYWFYIGLAYWKSGMLKEAIEAYKQAIRISPDFDGVHINLGAAFGESGMWKEAIESFKNALRINPDNDVAYYNLGVAYGNSGRHKEEIESYKQAIRINPDYDSAHFNIGYAYGDLGMHKEAIESYKQAIRINPDDYKAYSELGVVYTYLGMLKEAIESYKQAIRINPDFALAHYNLGITYQFLDDRGSALEEYKILKPLDIEKANELFNLIYK